jgi:hypothetical protein
MRYLKNINHAINILAGISVWVATGYASGWRSNVDIGSILFNLYLVLPYLIIWWIVYKTYGINGSKASRIAIFIITLLTTIIALAVSLESIFGKSSSTSGLVFLIIPFISLLIIVIVYPLIHLLLNYFIETKQIKY